MYKDFPRAGEGSMFTIEVKFEPLDVQGLYGPVDVWDGLNHQVSKEPDKHREITCHGVYYSTGNGI